MAAREHEITLYNTEGVEVAAVRVIVRGSKIEFVTGVYKAAAVTVEPDPPLRRIRK